MIQMPFAVPNADKTYKLADVPAALAYLDAGHARGKIVITLE
jgi:NADPH:quinone reductase-like Zn-dependent oxidoreductase